MFSSVCVCGGDHTVEAYSNFGLTSVLYATDFRSLLWTRMFLFRKPRVWFASWLYYQYGYSMIGQILTPRYFADETLASMISCRKYLVSIGVLRRVTWRTWHLEGLKLISHIFSLFSRLSRSFWKTWPSLCELRAKYIAVSSAKSLTLDLTCSGRWCIQEKELDPELSPAGRQKRQVCNLNIKEWTGMTLPTQLGQLKTRQGVVAKSSVVLQRPCRVMG